MKVCLPPLEVSDEEGFSPDKDIFQRAGTARGMTFLISESDYPLVIAFDGPWGSGKTTFLKMWAGELRKEKYQVIFFDAFENDYIDDAFAAIVREVVQLVEESKSVPNRTLKKFKQQAAALGSLLVRGSANVAIKVLMRSATAGFVDAADLRGIQTDLEGEMQDVAKLYMQQFLDKPKAQKEIVTQFREALSQLPKLLSSKNGENAEKPIVFIIDELDRCRPDFALKLLERVKHFMSVNNVHFVLGVNLVQLESSVKFAYGSDVNATLYLQKFINLTILNGHVTEGGRDISLERYALHLTKQLGLGEFEGSMLAFAVPPIIRIMQLEGASFRTLDRAFTTLVMVIKLTPENQLRKGSIVGGLIAMKIFRPDLFRKAKHGQVHYQEVENFLRFRSDREEEYNWERRMWMYVLQEVISKDVEDMGRAEFRGSSMSRLKIVQYHANNIVDRLR